MKLETLSTYQFPKNGIECYYYTDTAEHALDIVQKHHLYGSVPSRVNDPDDLKFEIANFENSPYILNKYGFQLSPEISTTIAKNISDNSSKRIDNAYRFVCMAEATSINQSSVSDLRFWSMYSNCFSGVRFPFRIDKDFMVKPLDDETFFDQVTYHGHSAKLDFSSITSETELNQKIDTKDFLQNLCYSKSAKWECEHEWRLGSTLSRLEKCPVGKSEYNYFFIYNPNNLLGVDIGQHADSNAKSKLISVLKEQGKRIREVHCQNLTYVEI